MTKTESGFWMWRLYFRRCPACGAQQWFREDGVSWKCPKCKANTKEGAPDKDAPPSFVMIVNPKVPKAKRKT